MSTSEDRVSRKRLERLKEGLKERLDALATRKDDLLTISEIGIDQIIVDEAQEFRKLSFATNMSTLEGRRSERLAARLGPVCEVPLRRDEKPRPRAGARFRHADHQYARRDVHGAAADGPCGAPRARPARVRRMGLHLRRHLDRTRASALRQIQAGHALRAIRQRAGTDRHVPLLRRRGDAGGPARLCEGAGDPGGKRQILTAEPTRGLQGLSAPARRAHQGDRGARPRAGARRRHPALRHHRRPACRDRPAPGRSAQWQRGRTTSSTCSSRNAFRIWRETAETPIAARTASPSSCPAPAR